MDPLDPTPSFPGGFGDSSPASFPEGFGSSSPAPFPSGSTPDRSVPGHTWPGPGSGPQLLAIERELSGPGAQEALARHDAVLAGLDARLADALRDGVSPDDFPKLEQLREANVLARKILRLATRDGETNK